MLLKAYAKINWSLAVLGRRPDGYHLLDSIMQRVSLYDTLEISPAGALSLTVANRPDLQTEDNLVLRAAQLLRRHFGIQQGAALHLTKRIPSGAGLGGGSADAAAALCGLANFWSIADAGPQLPSLAIQLGADVPFFLQAHPARIQGIGEIITPLSALPRHDLVLLKPAASLSTPVVFRTYDGLPQKPANPDIQQIQQALAAPHGGQSFSAALHNALQPAATSLLPEIEAGTAALRQEGATAALMTGSGSAVFGVFGTANAASAAAARLSARWPECWAVHTL